MVTYIQFKSQKNQEPVFSGPYENEEFKSILGPLSKSILEATFQKNIVIIFGQNNLNLTPLIISLFLDSELNGDVLLGLPKNEYRILNTQYYQNFFSLLKGNDQFFYKNTLWCSSNRKTGIENNNKLIFELDNIEFRPKWGIRNYKKYIESSINQELQSGEINNRRLIVTFPLIKGLNGLNLDNINFSFEKHNFPLRKVSPKLVILESVNTTMNRIDSLFPLISYLLKNDMRAIIHFSWPYVNGMNELLDEINKLTQSELKRLKIFHVGKKLAIELKNDVFTDIEKSTCESSLQSALTNHPALNSLALEGRNWNSYYPSIEKEWFKNILFLTSINNTIDFNNVDKSIRESNEYDNQINQIEEDIKYVSLPQNIRYIFKFTPFIDSFVPPAALKYLFKIDNVYKRLDLPIIISDIKKRINDENSYLLDSLSTIVKSMSDTLDMYNYLNNVKTPKIYTKYSNIISFLLKSLFNEEYNDIVICDYNPALGFKKYMFCQINNIFMLIRKNLPFSYDKLIEDDFILFSPAGDYINKKLYNMEIVKFNFEYNPSFGEFNITVQAKSKENNDIVQRKMLIKLESIDNLIRNVNSYDFTRTILLLPGPLPIIRLDDEAPTISEGIDLFIRPFKCIVIFVNPGKDYIRAYDQVEKIKDFLFCDKNNSITKTDLKISYNLNTSIFMKNKLENILKNLRISKQTDTTEELENVPKINDTLSDIIRNEYIENEKEKSPSYYKELKDLWSNISMNKDYNRHDIKYSNESIQIPVKFEKTGKEEIISFPKGTYIRLITEGDDNIIAVEDLKTGQRIAYMQSDTKESIDNFFIKNYSSYNNITLEEIYEPFKCLGIFYKTLDKINFFNDYVNNDFEQLYWLNAEEKQQLYNNIRFLMEPINQGTLDKGAYTKEYFKKSIIWKSLIDVDTEYLKILKDEFEKLQNITIDAIYGLALIFGLDYENSSFKGLIISLYEGRNKYFFFNEKNLLAIAHMMNYCKIAYSYESLTSMGKDIRTVLQYVGASLKRVISGNENYLNDMDLIIEKKVMICKVI